MKSERLAYAFGKINDDLIYGAVNEHTLGCEIWRGKLKKLENLEMSTVGRGI